MEAAAADIQSQIRRHRATGIGVLLAAFVLVGVGPRNQRALFPTLPFGGPEALAAIIVPPPSNILYPGRGGDFLGSLGIPPGAGPGGFGPPGLPGGAPGPGIATVPGVPLPPAPAPQLATATALPDLVPGFAPGLPVFGGGVPGGSAGPGGGGSTPPGGGGGGGGGDTPPPSEPPATPVPEPASWLMMIGGVMLFGSMLRRRNRNRQVRAVQRS